MIPRGAAPLIGMRLAGQRPACSVFVCFGDLPEPDWWRYSNTIDRPELLVLPSDPIERLDLRCLLELDVILIAAEWSEHLSRLYERLQDYAEEITVMAAAFGDDIGWHWLKQCGRIEFGERHLVADGARRAA